MPDHRWNSRLAACLLPLIPLLTEVNGQNQAAEENDQHCQTVLELNPAGYWPADEGEGKALRDLSKHANHGTIYHVPWDEDRNLLEFTSAYQWLEICTHENYCTTAFSMGGWLVTRRASYRRNGVLFMAVSNPIRLWNESSIILRVRDGLKVEVVSNGKADAVGSLAAENKITTNQWQHILYTYENGTGKLYLNGELVQTKSGVSYQARKAPIVIGSCADWWALHPPGANSLDGSVRDLMLFDRALAPTEVAQLAAAKPATLPQAYGADVVVIDDRRIPLQEVATLQGDDLGRAMGKLAWRDSDAMVRRHADLLLPIVVQALDVRQARRDAASILMKLNCEPAKAAMAEARPRLIQMLQDASLPIKERATCAMALGKMRYHAKDAAPALVAVLEDILAKEGAHVPRVEDLLRNAGIRALLDIDPKDDAARAVLGKALAKPILDTVDLSRPELEGVRSLAESGKSLEALEAYRALDPKKLGDRYFSQGDPHREARPLTGNDRAYTPITTRGGYTYKLGNGRPFDGIEPATPGVVEKAVQAWKTEYPAATGWRSPNAPDLCRVRIDKTDADGNTQTAYLEGEHFVFDGSDAKVRGWSIALDAKGYIHIVGGQHNVPNPDHFIPGSWEKMGLSRDRNAADFPNQMYWVSKKPHDITAFEFVGQKNGPHQIPSPGYLNYMNFVQDHKDTIYLYGRISVGGWQSWGFYRYDVEARRWEPLGGLVRDLMASARSAHPDWEKYLIRNIRGSIASAADVKCLAWAWQPNFYNYCRSSWGVRFDRAHRMHVQVPIRGLDADARIVDSDIYAWSDDGGQTFHRADGTPVALPLTVNPSPEHDADLEGSADGQWWNLWLSLLRDAGYGAPK